MNSSDVTTIILSLTDIIGEHTGHRSHDINSGSLLREDLDVDSLTLHGILMSIEDRWGVMPTACAMREVQTVGDLAVTIVNLEACS